MLDASVQPKRAWVTMRTFSVGRRIGATWLGGVAGSTALLLLVGLAIAGRRQSVSRTPEIRLDVAPQSQISYNGSRIEPGLVPEKDDAFVFPSVIKGDQVVRSFFHATSDAFLKPKNKFPLVPLSVRYQWSYGGHSGDILVSRGPAASYANNKLTFSIERSALKELRSLSYPDFLRLQEDFSDWMLDKGGCSFFVPPNDRFYDYEPQMKAFWLALLSEQALLSPFANNHPFNGPTNHTFTAPASKTKPKDDGGVSRVNIWPIRQNGWLKLTWGGTALYPSELGGNETVVENGVSRQTSFGETLIHIFGSHGHYSLEPPKTLALVAQTAYFTGQIDHAQALPYPPSWIRMLGRTIAPIFNEWDLHNVLLLKKSNSNELPPYLFLVTPTAYIKADYTPATDNEPASHIAGYTADSAQNSNSVDDNIPRLFRRCLIVGSDSPDIDQVFLVLNGLAAGITNNFSDDLYRAAAFNNQTSVDIVHFFFYNGRQCSRPEVQGSSWSQALATVPPEHLAGAKSLDVFRLYSQTDSETQAVLHFHFESWNDIILQSVEIADGDSFHTDP
jgi:hypothetical protein